MIKMMTCTVCLTWWQDDLQFRAFAIAFSYVVQYPMLNLMANFSCTTLLISYNYAFAVCSPPLILILSLPSAFTLPYPPFPLPPASRSSLPPFPPALAFLSFGLKISCRLYFNIDFWNNCSFLNCFNKFLNWNALSILKSVLNFLKSLSIS